MDRFASVSFGGLSSIPDSTWHDDLLGQAQHEPVLGLTSGHVNYSTSRRAPSNGSIALTGYRISGSPGERYRRKAGLSRAGWSNQNPGTSAAGPFPAGNMPNTTSKVTGGRSRLPRAGCTAPGGLRGTACRPWVSARRAAPAPCNAPRRRRIAQALRVLPWRSGATRPRDQTEGEAFQDTTAAAGSVTTGGCGGIGLRAPSEATMPCSVSRLHVGPRLLPTP